MLQGCDTLQQLLVERCVLLHSLSLTHFILVNFNVVAQSNKFNVCKSFGFMLIMLYFYVTINYLTIYT